MTMPTYGSGSPNTVAGGYNGTIYSLAGLLSTTSTNYGRKIRIEFSGMVYNWNRNTHESFVLTNEFGETKPATSSEMLNDHTLDLMFEDFNNLRGTLQVVYDGLASLSGIDIPIATFTVTPVIDNLKPYGDYEYLELSNINTIGNVLDIVRSSYEVTEQDKYVALGGVVPSGDVLQVIYSTYEVVEEDKYVLLGTVTASGNSYLVGEIPV